MPRQQLPWLASHVMPGHLPTCLPDPSSHPRTLPLSASRSPLPRAQVSLFPLSVMFGVCVGMLMGCMLCQMRLNELTGAKDKPSLADLAAHDS